jgi:membrane protease YdiL (CAAX protease family)
LVSSGAFTGVMVNRKEAGEALALGLGLAALGNVLGLLDPPRQPPRAWTGAGLILCIGSLAATAWPESERWPAVGLGVTALTGRMEALGLTFQHVPRNLAGGVLLGLVLGAPGVALLVLPEHLLPAIPEDKRLGRAGALLFSFGHLLLATAAGEELAFRGILQHKLRRTFGPRAAVLLGALFFALWHGVFNARTLRAAGVSGPRRLAIGSALQMAAVYVGGVAFGGLRERSGSLIGPIAAHWLADLLLNLRLFLRRRRGAPYAMPSA